MHVENVHILEYARSEFISPFKLFHNVVEAPKRKNPTLFFRNEYAKSVARMFYELSSLLS